MASEIEVLEDTTTTMAASAAPVAPASPSPSPAAAADGEEGEGPAPAAEDDSLKNDVYTAAAYGDLEKLQRLVEGEGHPVTEPDGLGYHALQWAALNNRVAAAQYILEVFPPPASRPSVSRFGWPSCSRCLLASEGFGWGFGRMRHQPMHFMSRNFICF
jgi:hypothetical protein